MAKKSTFNITSDVQSVMNALAANNQMQPVNADDLKKATFMDAEMSTFEQGDECVLTEYTAEALLQVTGKMPINGNDAYFLVLPFKTATGTVVKRLFLGTLKKRVQEIDADGKNSRVVKASTYNQFCHKGSMYAILEELAGKTIHCDGSVQASAPQRNADRVITHCSPTTVYNFTIA